MRLSKLRFVVLWTALATGAILVTARLWSPGCTPVQDAGGVLRIPVNRLAKGEIRAFCYRDNAGEKLRFLLGRGSDGKIRAVMDACGQCYQFHKGYHASSGYLICRLCGNRYSIDRMEKGKASCVPVHLRQKETDRVIEVKTADLEAQRWLFR